jgi:hypothetical protein
MIPTLPKCKHKYIKTRKKNTLICSKCQRLEFI